MLFTYQILLASRHDYFKIKVIDEETNRGIPLVEIRTHPINRGRWVMEEILEYGRVRPFTSGLGGVFLDAATREQFGNQLPVP